MKNIIKGEVFVLGDNIDTDQIIPAEYLVYSLTDPEERKNYGRFALSGVLLQESGKPSGNIPFVSGNQARSKFNIIVAGKNFGCGSSREHAPFALNEAGVEIVIANSFSRIFYRNSIDGGFLIPIETDENILDKINTYDNVEIDLTCLELKNITQGSKIPLKNPGEILKIIKSGGLFEHVLKTDEV